MALAFCFAVVYYLFTRLIALLLIALFPPHHLPSLNELFSAVANTRKCWSVHVG